MSQSAFFGTYARFETVSKGEGSKLMGADNLVGDVYTIEFVAEDGERLAWMKNKFGAKVGFFDSKISRQLSLCEAKGWKIAALLSFVAFCDHPGQGIYWGEAALAAYDPKETAFDTFVTTLGARLAEGNRPNIELGNQGVAQVIESNGTWQPTKLRGKIQLEPGNALVKTRRNSTEKMIEQARRGNKGCYAISLVFVLLLIVALVLGLKSCGLF